jgi:hypothetical protein
MLMPLKIAGSSCRSFFVVVVATFAFTAMIQTKAEAKQMGPTAAAIVGGVAGLAVGAAVGDAHAKKNKKIYYEGYAPPYPPGQYGPYFNQAFSPTTGIVCYPAQRACYNNNGTVSGNWTRKVYGY